MNETGSSHTMEYYSTTKRNEPLNSRVNVSLGHIMLSDRGQTQKDNYRRNLSHEISRTANFTETESRGYRQLAMGRGERRYH